MKWLNIWHNWLIGKKEVTQSVKSVIMPRLELQISAHNEKHSSAKVRFGTLADVNLFIELEKQGYDGYLAWERHDFKKDLKQNPYAVYLLLEVENQVIAMISGRFTHKTAHISHLIVRPHYQRQGFGRMLLVLWIQLAQSQGIAQVSLEVRSDNHSAQQLYQQQGFETTVEVPDYYIDGSSALQMRLPLLTKRE